MKSKDIVVVHGSNRNENFGDILLMKLYKEWIEKEGSEVIMDRVGAYFSKYFQLPQLGLFSVLFKANKLVFGGGGYFGEPSSVSLKWNLKFFYDHLLLGLLFRLFGKEYIICGVGFGPISNKILRNLTIIVFNGAKCVSVRDNESKKFLIDYGFKKPVSVYPDSALVISDLQSKLVASNKIKTLGIHFSIDKNSSDFDFYFNQIILLLQSLENGLGDSVSISFIVDHGTSKKSGELYESINKAINRNYPIHYFIDPDTTLDLLSNFDYVITTKLHVAITSYALGVVPFSIAKHQKTIRFFNQIGKSDYHREINKIDKSYTDFIIDKINSNDKGVVSQEIIKKAWKNQIIVKDFVNNNL